MYALPTSFLAMFMLLMPAFCFAQQPAVSQSAVDPNSQLCTIAGTVVSANTGEPIRKAHVVLSLQRPDPDKKEFNATGDAAGHFSIDRIPAGSYDLVVSRDNYLPSHYGQNRLDKPGATFTLAAGDKITDLLFRMHKTGIITGRVLDEDGDPVRVASVSLLVRTTVRGKQKTEIISADSTNDLGEYRLIDLAPGRYLICMKPQDDDSMREPPRPTEVYLPTYYPGTSESARAATVEVKSGDEISGIDFVVAPKVPVRSYKVRGRVINSVAGHQDANIIAMAISSESQSQATVDPKTGNFEIEGIIPGEYVVEAAGIAGAKRSFARQDVNVVGGDVDGISLVLTQGIEIAGQVTFEGKSAASASNLIVLLLPDRGRKGFYFGGGGAAAVQPNGSFVMQGVNDGSYSLAVSSQCGECYVKAATANGADLLDQGVQVSSGMAPSQIAIVFSSNTGAVNGTVTGKDDLPAVGALVVLVPEGRLYQSLDQYKNTTTDQYGRFEIRGVPLGRYKVYAWEKVDTGSACDAEFFNPYENMAESVDVAANERKSVQLKMIPAGDSTN